MRPKDIDPNVPKQVRTENELANDLEMLEDEVEKYRRMIRVWNDAVRNGTVSNIPEEQLFDYETAGERLKEALVLLEETRLELSNLIAA